MRRFNHQAKQPKWCRYGREAYAPHTRARVRDLGFNRRRCRGELATGRGRAFKKFYCEQINSPVKKKRRAKARAVLNGSVALVNSGEAVGHATEKPPSRHTVDCPDNWKRKEYEKRRRNLQVELCRLQDWVKAESGA
jgi:hypothetical protein